MKADSDLGLTRGEPGRGVQRHAPHAGGQRQGGQAHGAQQHGGDQAGGGQVRLGQALAGDGQQDLAPHPAQALGQRPVGRRRRRGQQAHQAEHAHHAQQHAPAGAPAQGGRVALGDAQDAGDHHHRRDQPGAQAQRLQAEVGRGRAQGAHQVARRLGRGGVEARIGRVIGGEGGDQGQAHGGDHRAAQPRADSGWAQPAWRRMNQQFDARTPRDPRHAAHSWNAKPPTFRPRGLRGVYPWRPEPRPRSAFPTYPQRPDRLNQGHGRRAIHRRLDPLQAGLAHARGTVCDLEARAPAAHRRRQPAGARDRAAGPALRRARPAARRRPDAGPDPRAGHLARGPLGLHRGDARRPAGDRRRRSACCTTRWAASIAAATRPSPPPRPSSPR